MDMTKPVTTICYKEKREWETREEALRFFLEGVRESDGSEKARYAAICCQILDGMELATDEVPFMGLGL